MRLVYISRSVIPSRTANSVHVMNMGAALAAHGHEVHVLAPNLPSPVEVFSDAFSYYGVANNFHLHKLPWLRTRYAFVRTFSRHSYGLLAALKAYRLTPDLVFGRYLPGCFYTAVVGLPTIYDSHNPEKHTGHLDRWMFKRLVRSTSFRGLTVTSDEMKQFYIRRYAVSAETVHVAYNGAGVAPTARSGASFTLPGATEKLRVGYTGHLYAGKGMEVVAGLAEACPWAVFHVIGGAPDDLAYWRRRLADTKNVFLHGFVPPADVSRYHRAMDVLVAPYREQVEVAGGRTVAGRWMAPLKVFEYMAAGKPIVCSQLPLAREVLVHDESALLCPPGDLAAWAAALQHLYEYPEERQRLGRAARQAFETKYSWQARAKLVLKLAAHTSP